VISTSWWCSRFTLFRFRHFFRTWLVKWLYASPGIDSGTPQSPRDTAWLEMSASGPCASWQEVSDWVCWRGRAQASQQCQDDLQRRRLPNMEPTGGSFFVRECLWRLRLSLANVLSNELHREQAMAAAKQLQKGHDSSRVFLVEPFDHSGPSAILLTL